MGGGPKLQGLALQQSNLGSVNSPISLGRPNNERHCWLLALLIVVVIAFWWDVSHQSQLIEMIIDLDDQ